MLQIKIFPVNPLGANCYVVWEDSPQDRPAGAADLPCLLADPGFYRPDEEDAVFTFLRENHLFPDAVFLTHGHFDHTWGVASVVRRFGCPVWMDAKDDPVLRNHAEMLQRLGLEKNVEPFAYEDAAPGRVIRAGGASWQVVATPGHTPGGVCYYCPDAAVVLTGDTLFAGSIGRTDLDGGDYDTLMHSLLDTLMALPGETDVLPGHGRPTTIAREGATNPFLLPFNEPDTPWWNQDGLGLESV